MPSPSLVQYGKLEFHLEHIYKWDHQAVLADLGSDFLYNKVVIGVQCVFHPRATRSNAVAGKPLVGDWGVPGAESVADLRTYMMQPRLDLRITMGGVEFFRSPPMRSVGDRPHRTDSKLGPVPLDFRVIGVWDAMGGKTLVCSWEVETFTNDHNHRTRTPSVLSHRWTMTHEIDDLNYTTRVIEGEAVFRADLLTDHPDRIVHTPDDFRRVMFHPIPPSFKREKVSVSVSADGRTGSYRIVDQEQTLNLGVDSPVLKIKGTWEGGVHAQSLVAIARRHVAMNVEVWGRRTSLRQELIYAALRAVAAFGFRKLIGSPTLYYKTNLRVDVVDKYVQLQVGVHTDGFIDTLWTKFFRDVFDIGAAALTDFPEDLAGIGTVAAGANPRPPNSAGSRGTYIGRMMAQTLSGPAFAPSAPPDEEAARDFTFAGTRIP